MTKHRKDLAREGREVEEVLHVRAEDKPADLGPKGLVKLSKLGPHSKWQAGPSFLTLPCKQWPLRDLAAINLNKAKAAAAAAELVVEGTQPSSCEVFNTATLTEAQARSYQIIMRLMQYGM